MAELERLLKNTLTHMEQGFDRRLDNPEQDLGRTAAGHANPTRNHESPAGANPANDQRFASLNTAIARFKQCVQELGTLVAALEQLIERQVEKARERSLGPGM